MAEAPRPVDKKPPEYYEEMERRTRAAEKKAYDEASPLGRSIPAPEKKARGGSIRGGGCEQRGKTRGRMI